MATRGWARAIATIGDRGGARPGDQAGRRVAASSAGSSVNVFLGIDLTNTRNTGVAFGALEGGGLADRRADRRWRWPCCWATSPSTPTRPWLWLPVGMLLGGALGNLADRARLGAVIDFIDPIAWPAFNLADTAIVLGVLGLLYVIEGPPGERDERAPGRGGGPPGRPLAGGGGAPGRGGQGHRGRPPAAEEPPGASRASAWRSSSAGAGARGAAGRASRSSTRTSTCW